jgi:heat-inducible transcriptional repressor
LLRDITSAISRLTHLMTIATTVRDPHVVVRSAVVSALGPKQALLVLVLSNGHIENRMVECPVGLTLEDVGLVNEHLNALMVGKTLSSLTKAKPVADMAPAPEKLLATLLGTIKSLAKDLTRGILITEGEEFIFAQPEFKRDAHAMASLLAALDDMDLFQEAIQENVQQVTIGRENKLETMHQFSLVRRSFYVGEDEAGIIALLGPTRMAYDRSIPLVHYAAKALSESLTKFLR